MAGQFSHGAMGNAAWTGVHEERARESRRAGPTAVQASFDGMDSSSIEDSPDLSKPLDIGPWLDGEVMLAWAMNGEDCRAQWLSGASGSCPVLRSYWAQALSDIRGSIRSRGFLDEIRVID